MLFYALEFSGGACPRSAGPHYHAPLRYVRLPEVTPPPHTHTHTSQAAYEPAIFSVMKSP